MATTFRCKLITPEAQVFDDASTAAIVPVWDGQMGFLPNRSAFVGELGNGELRVDFPDKSGARGGTRHFFISGGFVQMLRNELTILAAHAVPAENLTEADAQAEANAARAKSTAGLNKADADRVNAAKQRAEAKLAAAKKFRSLGGI